MFKLILAFVLLVHGLIHLMGFAKEYQLADIKELSGKTLLPMSPGLAKTAGVMWLFTSLFFIAAVGLLVLNMDTWWIPAVPAVLLSQLLIILYWPDAKFGTIANIIVLLTCLPAIATWQFNRMVAAEIDQLYAAPPSVEKMITEESLVDLPPIVQTWLRHSQIVGKPAAEFVHLEQRGEMRTEPDGKWMPFAAEQFFRIEQPGFVWQVSVQMAPMLFLQGRDKYMNNHGNMLIKLLSLLPIANASGPEIDQGALLRYVSEIIWFPSAALADYISWQPVDATHAQVSIAVNDTSYSGIFAFTETGKVIGFQADRYKSTGDTYELLPWIVSLDPQGYREFHGVRIPARGQLTWKTAQGDFTWFRLEITDISY